MPSDKPEFLEIVRTLKASENRGQALRQETVDHLAKLPGYNSCYIYALCGDELILDCYCGEPTVHSRIAVGRGICGTAVAEARNQIVPDVARVENYLCCSLKTKAELVVLVRQGGRIIGQIDIDGHTAGAFGEADEAFLEEVAELLAERWE